MRELKRLQFLKHFFERREAALLLEGSTKELDEHDMLADGQNDLGHEDLIILGPGAVRVDAFGKCEKSFYRQFVRRVRETEGGVLGRNTCPCGEKKPDSGSHQVFQYVRICHFMPGALRQRCNISYPIPGILRQQLRESPVVIGSVKVVDDQQDPRTKLRHPAHIEVIERADIRAFHGKRVAEADRRDRAHEVTGIDGVNAGEVVGAGGESGGE